MGMSISGHRLTSAWGDMKGGSEGTKSLIVGATVLVQDDIICTVIFTLFPKVDDTNSFEDRM